MTDRELMQQALEALEIPPGGQDFNQMTLGVYEAIKILRERLAQPYCDDCGGTDPECPLAQPCDMGEMCLDCQPRGPHGECPDQQPETVMAEYKFQTYAAYKTDGEMKIGVVPEQEQKPVAWMEKDVLPLAHIIKAVVRREKDETYTEPLYTSPQPRQWVGLTDAERRACTQSPFSAENYLAIEAKLREKNT